VAEPASLRIDGELDARSVPALARRLRAAALPAAIDLSGVSAIDSAGVAFLRTLQARASAAGKAVPALLNAPAHYHQLIAAHRVRPWE
jgi:ABC-type transporter Mla MlaB component